MNSEIWFVMYLDRGMKKWGEKPFSFWKWYDTIKTFITLISLGGEVCRVSFMSCKLAMVIKGLSNK